MCEALSMNRRSKFTAREKRNKRTLKYCDWYNRRYDLYFLPRPYAPMVCPYHSICAPLLNLYI